MAVPTAMTIVVVLEAVGLLPDAIFRSRTTIAILKAESTTAEIVSQRKKGVLGGRTNKEEAIPSKTATFSTIAFCQTFIPSPITDRLQYLISSCQKYLVSND
jgi:hypothetical protein